MAQIRFLNLVKPVMFLIPEIKGPTKAVKYNFKHSGSRQRQNHLVCNSFIYLLNLLPNPSLRNLQIIWIRSFILA